MIHRSAAAASAHERDMILLHIDQAAFSEDILIAADHDCVVILPQIENHFIFPHPVHKS